MKKIIVLLIGLFLGINLCKADVTVIEFETIYVYDESYTDVKILDKCPMYISLNNGEKTCELTIDLHVKEVNGEDVHIFPHLNISDFKDGKMIVEDEKGNILFTFLPDVYLNGHKGLVLFFDIYSLVYSLL